jgi:ATP-dependent RNA helicase RhlE
MSLTLKPAMPELYMHRIGRTGRAKREQQLVSLHQERKKQGEIEVLMNMELAIEPFQLKWKFLPS